MRIVVSNSCTGGGRLAKVEREERTPLQITGAYSQWTPSSSCLSCTSSTVVASGLHLPNVLHGRSDACDKHGGHATFKMNVRCNPDP